MIRIFPFEVAACVRRGMPCSACLRPLASLAPRTHFTYHPGMSTPQTVHDTPHTPVICEHIAITPGVCGGKPRIAGHRIKVQHIAVWHERMGMSPDEIASTYALM